MAPGELATDAVDVQGTLRCCSTHSVNDESLTHPLVHYRPDAIEAMRFVKIDALLELTAPLPRCQDLPREACGVMRACDKLVAISHGWRFQVHPDPHGAELGPMKAGLRRIKARCGGRGSEVFVFLDFLAIPQRPFDPQQAERTPEEDVMFRKALTHLDSVFLYADYFLHLDVPVEVPLEEGLAYTLRCGADDAWSFRDIGGIVQCTAANAFDSLLAIDGVAVDSAASAEEVLSREEDAVMVMERHRYGIPNMTPSSDRGWIYLERFITMVVAAMLPQAAFEETVFANEAGLLREIHAGAECLRTAAEHAALQISGSRSPSRCAHSLDGVFRRFEDNLVSKKFSAASVDKSLNPALRSAVPSSAAAPSDAELVAGIMKGLVGNLALWWQTVQAQRRNRSYHVELLRTYVVNWASFSPDFVQKIHDQMGLDLGYAIMLVVLPLFLMLLPLLLPYAPPNTGWSENWLHTFLGNQLIGLVCFSFIPQWLQVMLGFPLPLSCQIVWPAFTTIATTIAGPVLLCLSTGIYPFPFTPLIASITYFGCLPLLWFLLPALARTKRVASKFMRAIVAQVLLTGTFCTMYPFLNVWLHSAAHVWQMVLIAAIFLGARVFFEQVFERLIRDLGPDVQPAMVFTAELAYQFALCDFFRNVRAWGVFAVFIGADVAENVYYLYCFMRNYPPASFERVLQDCMRSLRRHRPSADEVCRVSPRTRKPSDDDFGVGIGSAINEGGFCDGGAATIAAVLLLRQLADILAPMIFSVALAVLYQSPTRRFNLWVSGMDCADLHRALSNLGAALTVEIVLAVVSYAALKSQGMRPLLFLHGVMVGSSRNFFIVSVATVAAWFGALQSAHLGCDFTFEFAWASGNRTWSGGESWIPPPV